MADFKPLEFKVSADTQVRVFRHIFDNMKEWFRQGYEVFEIEVRLWSSKRTYSQNKRLWKIYGVLASDAWAQGQLYTKDEWHESLKDKFLPKEEFKNPFGEIIQRSVSTRDLSVAEMSEYQNEIQSYAATYFGIEWEF